MFTAIVDYMETINPILSAFYATPFTWGHCSWNQFGFLIKGLHRAFMDGMLGFTGEVMVADSFWSLSSPAIEMKEGDGFPK